MKPGRAVAAGVALCAWVGLLVQCAVTFRVTGSVLLTLWVVAAYFTILTNLLVAIVFTAVAANATKLRAGWVLAGTTLSILLVGAVYGLLLHGSMEFSGGSAAANVLLHMVTPMAVLLYWIFFAEKGTLRWRDAVLWAMYPLAYLAYAMGRGSVTGRFAYPFIDLSVLGWGRVMLNAGVIAIVFVLASLVVIGVDHRAGPVKRG